METFNIGKKEITFFGKLRGHATNKFNRVAKLAAMFNDLDDKLSGMIARGNCDTDMARCAAAVKLLMHTGIRVGNEGSAEGYMTQPHPYSKKEPEFVQTYGLTTLKVEHVVVQGNKVYLNFLGKKSVANSFKVTGDLAKQVTCLMKAAHREQYGTLLEVTHYELTKFIKKYVGRNFSPKDFRTLRANIDAWQYLEFINKQPLPRTKSELRKEAKLICEAVAEQLNNLPGTCKKSYIDDQLFEYHNEIRYGK